MVLNCTLGDRMQFNVIPRTNMVLCSFGTVVIQYTIHSLHYLYDICYLIHIQFVINVIFFIWYTFNILHY